jgi:hypothetical protein
MTDESSQPVTPKDRQCPANGSHAPHQWLYLSEERMWCSGAQPVTEPEDARACELYVRLRAMENNSDYPPETRMVFRECRVALAAVSAREPGVVIDEIPRLSEERTPAGSPGDTHWAAYARGVNEGLRRASVAVREEDVRDAKREIVRQRAALAAAPVAGAAIEPSHGCSLSPDEWPEADHEETCRPGSAATSPVLDDETILRDAAEKSSRYRNILLRLAGQEHERNNILHDLCASRAEPEEAKL